MQTKTTKLRDMKLTKILTKITFVVWVSYELELFLGLDFLSHVVDLCLDAFVEG